MGNEESLPQDLASKLRLDEPEKKDAFSGRDRDCASDEVPGDRVAPESTSLGTSTHTDLLGEVDGNPLAPSFVNQSVQETADKKESAVDDAPKPPPAPVTGKQHPLRHERHAS